MEAFNGRTDHIILRYGPWMAFPWITRITESFANQTIVEPGSWENWGKALEFSGGNVAVTVHGFLRGANRRKEKSILEMMRNAQAAIAQIPCSFMTPDKSQTKIGLGQLILWFLGFSFYIQSDMVFQFNMLIKTMEFEHSAQYDEEYAFNIVFEKLSFGLVQFIVDLVVSGVTGFFLSNVANSDEARMLGQSANSLLANTVSNNTEKPNPVGETVETLPDPISMEIDVKGNSVESVGEEVGQIVRIISDSIADYKNIPQHNSVLPQLDSTLEWKDLPFLSSFPQSFSFDLGEYNHAVNLRVYDYQDDDEEVHYDLWMELKKDGEPVYLGKVQSNTQYNLGSLAIYISNFKMETTRDGYTTSFIEGMVADLG
jgi:hypothetical protein